MKDGSINVVANGNIRPNPTISTTAFISINRNRKEIPNFCLFVRISATNCIFLFKLFISFT